MGDVALAAERGITQFRPQQARADIAKTDALLDYAKRMQDTALLEVAIDEKIALMRGAVGWWAANVRGRGRKSNNADRNYLLDQAGAEKIIGIQQEQISRWTTKLKNEQKFRDSILIGMGRMVMVGDKVHVTNNSGDNEWYTPPELITAARDAMGDIHVDPASSAKANETVDADEFHTQESDGLAQTWKGSVWMNPPYAQPAISQFCEKLVREIDAGHTTQACVLVNNATETQWFQLLLSRAAAVCFIKARVRFLDPEGKPSGSPLQGQAVIYIGNRKNEFAGKFQHHGWILYA